MAEEVKKDKDEVKERPKLKNPKILRPGDKQKSIILTTDGININMQVNEVNALEVEMMLTKALSAIQKGR